MDAMLWFLFFLAIAGIARCHYERKKEEAERRFEINRGNYGRTQNQA